MFNKYQHVTSFSNMRSAPVGKRTEPQQPQQPAFTGKTWANTLEYWSKYTNILYPTVRENRSVVC